MGFKAEVRHMWIEIRYMGAEIRYMGAEIRYTGPEIRHIRLGTKIRYIQVHVAWT